jgi:WS/DGAT/MGAT family acyltransferase
MLDARAWTRRMSDFARAIEVTAPAFMRRPARAPWNAAVSGKRRVAVSSISFQEVRGIRSALGGTVNDVVLTILGGALGRYLLAHGHGIEGRKLRFSIPVNVRKEDERGALGNRVSMMLPDIPAGIADPVARLDAVREEMGRLKEQDQSSAIETFIRLAEIAPAALHALAGQAGVPAGQSNVLCTNVPGPLIPLYSVGHRMLSHYPLIPLAGDQGIAVGILSYDKSLYFGIMYDPSIIKDADIISQYLEEEFIALRSAAGVTPSDLPAIGISTNGHSEAVSVPPDLAREAATATG